MPDLTPLCNAVMRKVAATGAVVADRSERDNTERAVAWMRHEIKAFFFEARYVDAREAAMSNPSFDNVTVSLIAASAVEGILTGQWPASTEE